MITVYPNFAVFDGLNDKTDAISNKVWGSMSASESAELDRAIMPGFSRRAHDAAAVRAGFLDIMSAMTLFAVPAAFGIAAIAEPLVNVLLTDTWADVVPFLQVLAFLGAMAAILSSAFPAFFALGRPRSGAAHAAPQHHGCLPRARGTHS